MLPSLTIHNHHTQQAMFKRNRTFCVSVSVVFRKVHFAQKNALYKLLQKKKSGSSLVQSFVETCVGFDVVHLSINLVWRFVAT